MAKKLPEDPIVKRFRKTKSKMWLYHSVPKKTIDNVKQKGLDLKYHGTTHGSPVEHPSGKPAFSYSTNKSYAAVWGDKDSVLLVNVPTKDLFFGIRTTMFGWKEDIDEYQDINNIKPQDIIFPGDSKYIKIEKIIPYLKKGKFY
jgi:hypothetical protein